MITTQLDQAIQVLTQNDLVAIPTETVYGLAANAYDDQAVQKIYQLKKRPAHNPLIVHLKSVDDLAQIAQNIPPVAYELAQAFWPGPLTLLLEKQAHISDVITAGKPTVAVRVPNHPLTLELLNKLPFPLVAPSANPFGSISPTTAQHVFDYFGEDLKVVLDGGPCGKGIESTIIGFVNQQAVLYRLGSVAVEDIEKITGQLTSVLHNEQAPEAPGMLSRHYAPNTTTYLTDDVLGLLKNFEGQKVGLLRLKNQIQSPLVAYQEVLSESGNMPEAAQNLYAALHRLDRRGLDVIIAERMPEEGLGKTINDKLERATKKA